MDAVQYQCASLPFSIYNLYAYVHATTAGELLTGCLLVTAVEFLVGLVYWACCRSKRGC